MRLLRSPTVISRWADCVLSKNGYGCTVFGIFRRLVGEFRFGHPLIARIEGIFLNATRPGEVFFRHLYNSILHDECCHTTVTGTS